ncbi:hypothetical protein [Brachybacterium sp. NPDC056505]|uniref:hypothetical protein n=1 Tax=Brachybacterium sp. NPDC056505 TaxID=3345843 RepID=UPI003671D702
MTSAPAGEARGLLRFFVVPGALIATNWAAVLGALTVIGLVPALAAATHTTSRLREHPDAAFRSTLSRALGTLRRDAPTSVLAVLVILAIGFDALFVASLPSPSRVFVMGVLIPPAWATIAWISAYVQVAAEASTASWFEVAREAMGLCVSRPLRATLAPAAIIALSPLWLLAPLTIACGFSVPPMVVGALWGAWGAESREPRSSARPRVRG